MKWLPQREGLPEQGTDFRMKRHSKRNQLGLPTTNSKSAEPHLPAVLLRATAPTRISADTREALLLARESRQARAGHRVREVLLPLLHGGEQKGKDGGSKMANDQNVNAFSWVVQPTAVEPQSFMSWKDEALRL